MTESSMTATPPAGAAAVPAAAPASRFVARPTRDALGALLAWLVQRSGLDDDGFAALATSAPQAVAPGANDPLAAATALADGHPAPALTLAAAALPPREGVWWAWIAVRHAMHVLAERAAAPPVAADAQPLLPPSAAERAALGAVERWIGDPSEANRRAAWDAGQAADLGTPAGCVCAAVFFANGSIASPQCPVVVPPPPGAHVTFAATAVLLAAVATDAANLTTLVRASVAQAAELATRLGGWEATATLARQHFDQQREQHGAAIEASTPKPQSAAPGA